MVSVSGDGCIRLSYANLQALKLVHEISGLDEGTHVANTMGVTPTTISGYTEWLSHPDRTVTIGWDWEMEGRDSRVRLLRVSDPRSNIMMLESNGAEAGPEKTRTLLGAFVDSFAWQTEVKKFVAERYG
jgi:hypothetical protein